MPPPAHVPLHTPLPIFVYGTLKHGQRNHDAHFPVGAIRSILPATVDDVGLYEDDHIPYACPLRGATLHGQVVELTEGSAQAAMARQAIDELEGFDAARPDSGWYRRVAITASIVPTATPVQCWIYLMDRPPAGTRGVPGGVWLSGTRSDARPER